MRSSALKALKDPLLVAPVKRLRTQGAQPDPSPAERMTGAARVEGLEPNAEALPTAGTETPTPEAHQATGAEPGAETEVRPEAEAAATTDAAAAGAGASDPILQRTAGHPTTRW